MSTISHNSLNKVFCIFFIILSVFLCQNELSAATTGQVYPTLGTSISETPWRDNAWTTPTNIYSDNDATTNVTAASFDTGDQTYVLKATGFNFNAIPDGSTINGITARINAFYRSGQGSGSINLCQLLNISRTKVGTNQCATAVALTTNAGVVITIGGASDTWGNALTTAWIKDPDFGIAIGVLATAQNADVDIDYVSLEIGYTPPAPSGTVSAFPTSCTISSGASTCTIPFTWSISNATAPNLYNATTANQYSTLTSGTGVSYPITNGSNTVQVRDSGSVLNSVMVTGSCAGGTSWDGNSCETPPLITTIETGADPSANTVAPGSSMIDVNYFTLQTNTGTETITAITIDLSTNNGVALLAVTNDLDTILGSTASPATGSNIIPVTGMSAGTSAKTFKVRVSSLAHNLMPSVPGAEYSITTPVTAWTGSYTHAGIDTNTNALIIDNASPANVTNASASAGNTQVVLSWINPINSDFSNTIVLRLATSAPTGTPSEGTTYVAGDTIPTGLVACVVASPNTTCTDGGLTNGIPYYYKIFTRDTRGNYSATGIIPTGSPATPAVTTYTITSSAGVNGTITPSGTINIAEGGSQSYTAIPDLNYEVAALIVDSATTTGTTYTFTNVQTNHTIRAIFSALPETPVATTTKQRVPRPIKVTFSGKAFPWAKISILDKELTSEKIIEQEQEINQTGTFEVSFVGIIEGAHSFALLAKDSMGRASQTKFFNADISKEEMIVKEYVILPPTIDILNGQITRGKNITVTGSAAPYYIVDIELDGVQTKGVVAHPDGSYQVEIPTGTLSFGKHTVRTRQADINERKGSDFSISRNFIVSNLAVVQTDLNGDGVVDIKDWSIFLARFTSRDNAVKRSIDLTNDGKVDISDFSVFIRAIRRVK